MLLAYTPVNWSMSIELRSQVWENRVIIKSLYLKVYLKLSTIFWTLMFFGIQLNYTDVFTDEHWLYQLVLRGGAGCWQVAVPHSPFSQRVKHNALHRLRSRWYKSLICTLMRLFALCSSTAGKRDRSSLPTLHNTSVMLCNSCTASNRGAAGFHWLTLQVDVHVPVGNENWFLQIHCTRWLKYFFLDMMEVEREMGIRVCNREGSALER